jgi:hypothetical protein
MITYSKPIVTTYKSVLAIFILPTDPKIVTVVGTILSTILFNLIFPVLP